MDGLGCLVVIGFLAALIIVWRWALRQEREQAARDRQAAYDTYQAALAELQADPTNADLKQQALALGRHYADWTRDNQGVAVYDETALMNDIGAATAGGGAHAPPAPPAPSE